MSVHDSQRIRESLLATGHIDASSPAEADVLVLTTCSVREKARQKVLSALGRWKRLKERRPAQVVVVAGCVAQQDGRSLLEDIEHVDLVLGPDHLGAVAQLVERVRETGERLCLVGFDDEASFLPLGAPGVAPVSAYVTIQKGCDEGCAYCIVPTVRGPGRCRPASEVVDEVAALVERGAREVVLLGQTVNSYEFEGIGFVELLRRVGEVEGVARIRYESAHPRFLDQEMIEAHLSLPPLCEHLHLPVQSGSNEVLRRMGRGHSREDFLRWVEGLRQVQPEIGLSTDLFVGFPGEAEHDFLDTLDLIEQVGFDAAYSFKYSPRPGTPAAALDDDVEQQVKVDRLARLQALQGAKTVEILERFVGQTVEVLVEGESKAGGQLRGRSRRNTVVNIDLAPDLDAVVLIGSLVPVEITQAGGHSIRGRLGGMRQSTSQGDAA